jgi:hypothetical protein
MGNQGLGEVQLLHQSGDGFFAVPEAEEDPEPVFVSQAFGQKGQGVEAPFQDGGSFEVLGDK